jgi:choline dehydrogenase-like flavoprotein
VCIAGGGAAGITLARRLASAGIGVVLLESGGRTLEERTQALYDGDIAGAPYFPLSFGRLRYLGGTTNHWTGWCRPLDPEDFARQPWVPHTGWPIDATELEPFYRLAQQTCELGPLEYSPEYWAKVTRQRLLPVDPDLVETAIWQFSPPTRFGDRYLPDLNRLEHLNVILHANLVDVETTRRGSRVERVRVKTLEGKQFFVRPGALVLALGAIENARVLLACDHGHPGGLGNENGVVGRFFMEHPHSTIGAVLASFGEQEARLYQDVFNLPDRAPPAVRAALVLPRHVLEREKLIGFSLALEPNVPYPPLGKALKDGVQELVTGVQRVSPQRLYQLYARMEQTPHKDSRIRLSSKRDSLGMRRAVLEWKVDALTRRTLNRGMEIFSAAFGKARLGRVYSFCHTRDLYRAGAWPDIMGGHHHMGTTRMGDDPETSVVDRNCRVHSVENLYIAGSSVFATSGFANPTLTIVALAHRLANHLAEAAP